MEGATVMSTDVQIRTDRRIVFKLADEHYAVDIRKVKEIIKVMHITRVPKSAPYVEGVINLRGRVLPVLNLRKRFNMPETEGSTKRFLVVEHNGALVGLIVDAVDEVLEFTEDMVLPPPLLSRTFNREFLEGIVKRQDDIVILLSIEKLLDKEIERLRSNASG